MIVTVRLANDYWLCWFVVMFTLFIIPESLALISNHPEFTLSAAIWRLEGYKTAGWGWNAFRFLFAGVLLLLDVWLFFHFIWHKFA